MKKRLILMIFFCTFSFLLTILSACNNPQVTKESFTGIVREEVEDTPIAIREINIPDKPDQIDSSPITQSKIDTAIPLTPLNKILQPSPTSPVKKLTRIERKGSLKVPTNAWFSNMDPHKEPSSSFAAWGPGIAYHRLMKFTNGPNVKLPSMKTECDICSEWQFEDLHTITFTINSNIPWVTSNGSTIDTVSAQDIAFSLNRQKTEGWSNAHILHMIKDATAITDSKLKVTLSAPDADLFIALANGRSKILPHKNITNLEYQIPENVVSSGSWLLEKIDENSSALMIANPNNLSTPHLDNIEFHYLPEAKTRRSAYLVGLLDIYRVEQFDKDDVELEIKLEDPKPGLGLQVVFNTQKEPFNHLHLRRSVMNSINPKNIIENVWGNRAFFSMGYPMISSDWEVEESIWSTYFGNPDKSLTELEQQGLEIPYPITITSANYGDMHIQTLNVISDQLTVGGFAPSLQILNRREFGETALTNSDYQMLVGPTFPQTSPNGHLLTLLHSKGAWNKSGYSNSLFDQLLETQASQFDDEKRSQNISEINLILLNEGIRFMPVTMIHMWAWHDQIKHFYPNFSLEEYSHWEHISLID
jgi:ABC-type transport system substrate-binding protein